ncbi:hypothetical protein PHLCEN_2v8711 [Hermanssonia centrifuga]|uniref:JmjC domain-containing protein n=1 Tax=Hermanssonia centrifuga TaxID=98765 RepID=A0A2R6NSU5_9APHY|nr:hypothetical protein PHLCEN_2v8711 [Hermanssonia centrifuga]
MERFRKLVMAKNPEEYSPKPASVHSHPTNQSPVNVADQVTEPTENSARQSFGGCKRPTLSGKHWTLRRLLEQSSHFTAVPRISASSPQLAETLEAYERDGKPLIIEDWHEHPKWPRELFNIDWLLKKSGEDTLWVRDVRGRTDKQISFTDFIAQSRDDTFTPFHKDLCASSGQNIMCYTEAGGSSFWFMTASADAPAVEAFFQTRFGLEVDWEEYVVTVEELIDAPFTVYIAEQAIGDLVLVPPRSCHQVVNRGGLTVKTSWSRMTINGLKTALYEELPIYQRSSTETAFGPREYVKTAARRLHTLIAVFDFVLLGEYHSKHADLPTILSDRTGLPRSSHDNPRDHSSKRQPRLSAKARDIQTDISRWQPSACNLSCDFCGADIFQSFFECQYLCASRYDHHDGNEGDRITFSGDPFLGNGVLLCPTCYVEGRTCTCGKMKAVQCRPFDTLVLARNEAVDVVNATLNFLADSTLDRYDVINENIGMHSADALLAHRGGGIGWHSRHQYKQSAGLSTSDQGRSAHTDIIQEYRDKLVFLAKTYPSCRPLNSTSTVLGWYDQGSLLQSQQVEEREDFDESSVTASTAQVGGSRQDATETDERFVSTPSFKELGLMADLKLGSQDRTGSLPTTPSASSDLFSEKLEFTPSAPCFPQRSTSKSKDRVYIIVPPPPHKRRRTPAANPTVNARPTKKRKGLRQSPPADDSGLSTTARLDSEDERRLTADYANPLAAALASASGSSDQQPLTERMVLQGRGVASTGPTPDFRLDMVGKQMQQTNSPMSGPQAKVRNRARTAHVTPTSVTPSHTTSLSNPKPLIVPNQQPASISTDDDPLVRRPYRPRVATVRGVRAHPPGIPAKLEMDREGANAQNNARAITEQSASVTGTGSQPVTIRRPSTLLPPAKDKYELVSTPPRQRSNIRSEALEAPDPSHPAIEQLTAEIKGLKKELDAKNKEPDSRYLTLDALLPVQNELRDHYARLERRCKSLEDENASMRSAYNKLCGDMEVLKASRETPASDLLRQVGQFISELTQGQDKHQQDAAGSQQTNQASVISGDKSRGDMVVRASGPVILNTITSAPPPVAVPPKVQSGYTNPIETQNLHVPPLIPDRQPYRDPHYTNSSRGAGRYFPFRGRMNGEYRGQPYGDQQRYPHNRGNGTDRRSFDTQHTYQAPPSEPSWKSQQQGSSTYNRPPLLPYDTPPPREVRTSFPESARHSFAADSIPPANSPNCDPRQSVPPPPAQRSPETESLNNTSTRSQSQSFSRASSSYREETYAQSELPVQETQTQVASSHMH